MSCLSNEDFKKYIDETKADKKGNKPKATDFCIATVKHFLECNGCVTRFSQYKSRIEVEKSKTPADHFKEYKKKEKPIQGFNTINFPDLIKKETR